MFSCGKAVAVARQKRPDSSSPGQQKRATRLSKPLSRNTPRRPPCRVSCRVVSCRVVAASGIVVAVLLAAAVVAGLGARVPVCRARARARTRPSREPQRGLFRSAIQSSDQGRAQAASAPSCQWVVDGLPAPKQPKQPSREILDHSRRFIPNPVRPFPSQDSSRAITHTQLHHSVCPCVSRACHTGGQAPQAPARVT